MTLEEAIQAFVISTKEVDESLAQVVILPELYRLLKTYTAQPQNQTAIDQVKLMQSIKFKIKDCLMRYQENIPLKNALKQLESILEV